MILHHVNSHMESKVLNFHGLTEDPPWIDTFRRQRNTFGDDNRLTCVHESNPPLFSSPKCK